MTYRDIRAARFLARPNRFLARVEVDGREETVHVKNTGRCKELLLPGCTVYLEGGASPLRKTKYDLVAVEKLREDRPPLLINMDSQAPNKVFREWMESGLGAELGLPRPTLLHPETTWGNSRFDFYWEQSETGQKGFVEVKGCTLEEDDRALFPDAPTERGIKHLRELMACHEAGYQAAVCVVVQMEGMASFSPNDRTHPEFGAALREARRAGVRVLAVECAVTPDSLAMTRPVPVVL